MLSWLVAGPIGGSFHVFAIAMGWLYTIARNRALTTIERKTRNERVHGDLSFEMDDSAPPVPVALHAEIDGQVVRELIAALPEGPEKETVTLFYIEGQLSAREIADRLGVGKSAITMRLERFRARVKRDLAIRLTRHAGSEVTRGTRP